MMDKEKIFKIIQQKFPVMNIIDNTNIKPVDIKNNICNRQINDYTISLYIGISNIYVYSIKKNT
jgi:hypothetical protein